LLPSRNPPFPHARRSQTRVKIREPPKAALVIYTLRKMLVPEAPSDAQCTAAVPTELASVKWSVIVAPLKSSIVLPFATMAEVILRGCTSARSRALVGAPVVLTFILPMTPFVSKDCRAVAVPSRSVPLSPERKVNHAGGGGGLVSW